MNTKPGNHYEITDKGAMIRVVDESRSTDDTQPMIREPLRASRERATTKPGVGMPEVLKRPSPARLDDVKDAAKDAAKGPLAFFRDLPERISSTVSGLPEAVSSASKDVDAHVHAHPGMHVGILGAVGFGLGLLFGRPMARKMGLVALGYALCHFYPAIGAPKRAGT